MELSEITLERSHLCVNAAFERGLSFEVSGRLKVIVREMLQEYLGTEICHELYSPNGPLYHPTSDLIKFVLFRLTVSFGW